MKNAYMWWKIWFVIALLDFLNRQTCQTCLKQAITLFCLLSNMKGYTEMQDRFYPTQSLLSFKIFLQHIHFVLALPMHCIVVHAWISGTFFYLTKKVSGHVKFCSWSSEKTKSRVLLSLRHFFEYSSMMGFL